MHMQFSPVEGVPDAIAIESGAEGPRVTLLSGNHGDEISGVRAVERLLYDLCSGERTLKRGSLTLARANREALLARKRYLRYNLNRLYRDEYDPALDMSAYEYRRAQELKPILRGRDYVLDLHSAPIAREPFMMSAEQMPAEFFSRVGIKKIIIGWDDVPDAATEGAADTYAKKNGAVSATLEAGSHFDVASFEVSYRTAVRTLVRLGMLEEQAGDATEPYEPELYEMYAVLHRESEDYRYAFVPENFKFIAKGEPYAVSNGTELRAEEDSYLLCPMIIEESKVGEEIGYLGRRSK